MSIQQIPISLMYKKDNGMFVVDTAHVPFPSEYTFSEQYAIFLPPKTIGGNHTHKRVEAFISLSEDLEIVWQEETGEIQSVPMKQPDQLYLFIVPPYLPHATRNNNATQPAFLLEFSNEPPGTVERVELIKS